MANSNDLTNLLQNLNLTGTGTKVQTNTNTPSNQLDDITNLLGSLRLATPAANANFDVNRILPIEKREEWITIRAMSDELLKDVGVLSQLLKERQLHPDEVVQYIKTVVAKKVVCDGLFEEFVRKWYGKSVEEL